MQPRMSPRAVRGWGFAESPFSISRCFFNSPASPFQSRLFLLPVAYRLASAARRNSGLAACGLDQTDVAASTLAAEHPSFPLLEAECCLPLASVSSVCLRTSSGGKADMKEDVWFCRFLLQTTPKISSSAANLPGLALIFTRCTLSAFVCLFQLLLKCKDNTKGALQQHSRRA